VALVRTDVSEEPGASFIIVTAVKTSNLTLYSSVGRLLIVTYGDLKRCGSRGPSYPDEGGARFLRNVGSYKSHTA
jgi:hypothetical protein